MTQQRPWPNNMAVHRDRTAEEVGKALRRLNQLQARVERGEFTRPGLERDILELRLALQTALSHLMAAGAEVVPE